MTGFGTGAGKAYTRFQTIYETLRERICLLDFAPGHRLREDDLAEEFQVSRTPMRRVIARLESEGLVQSIQSVGTFVTEIDLDTLRQIYELRAELAILMGQDVDPAIRAEVHDEIARILTITERQNTCIGTRDFARLNRDAFQALLRLNRNEVMNNIAEALYNQSARVWIHSIPEIGLAREVELFRQEISEVQRALEHGDIRSVSLVRAAHIRQSWQRIVALNREAHGPGD
ncbi:GntR family transcriptional regulator [Paracoccus saliphilus]|uniref:GntR family transcriptional regulator n=1 Tax=Paracoccus saliphilus TaxID=405559 RepID=A0AA46A602_9RHOB|nr:GntR family transcriptional regulator [Paracoccus saliphilus]WCR02090.1 GntR family transcriptional regulator [Paracoccus saliphilus]SIS89884.1 transcriptional regulator, GntR family [Paracoccus saliphilus]